MQPFLERKVKAILCMTYFSSSFFHYLMPTTGNVESTHYAEVVHSKFFTKQKFGHRRNPNAFFSISGGKIGAFPHIPGYFSSLFFHSSPDIETKARLD